MDKSNSEMSGSLSPTQLPVACRQYQGKVIEGLETRLSQGCFIQRYTCQSGHKLKCLSVCKGLRLPHESVTLPLCLLM